MKIAIDKKKLGMSRHLVYDSETGETILEENLSTSDWIIGDDSSAYDVCAPLAMVGLDAPEIFCVKYKKAYLSLGEDKPPWNMCMPTEEFRRSIKNVLEYTQRGLETFEKTGYKQTHIKTQKVLQRLSRSLVHTNKIEKYVCEEENTSVRNCLKTFRPADDKFTLPVFYTRQNTVTGRLTVKKGPSVLTLAARHRDILASRYSGGKILQLDFKSLEPRVCRLVSGMDSAEDIYEDINKSVLGNKFSRKVVKLAVICSLYGASRSMLENVVGNKRSASVVLEKVREYFKADALVSNIKKDFSRNKFVQNYYGRILATESFDSHVLLSHYIQSTAVDVALLGFLNVLESVSDDVKPIFIVHDAIILDCPKEQIVKIEEMSKSGIQIGLGNFPASVTVLSDQQVQK